MRALSVPIARRRYLLPIAILRPGTPTDIDFVIANALLDTGATVSGIGPRVIADLGLISYGKGRLKSATEEVAADYYLFRVGLFTTDQSAAIHEQNNVMPYVFDEVDGFTWKNPADFDAILGMDVLSQCDLAFSRSGMCTINFG